MNEIQIDHEQDGRNRRETVDANQRYRARKVSIAGADEEDARRAEDATVQGAQSGNGHQQLNHPGERTVHTIAKRLNSHKRKSNKYICVLSHQGRIAAGNNCVGQTTATAEESNISSGVNTIK